MTHRRTLVLAVLTLALLASAYAADVAGKWTAEVESPRGVMQYTFEFKVDGANLTGKMISQRGEVEIQDGKVSGDEISFLQVLRFQDREIRLQYKGKVSGDEIQFTRTVGDRPPQEFVAKRAE